MSPSHGLTNHEYSVLKRLDTPVKIQNFLETIPINFEPHGDSCKSPRWVLRNNKAHCIEGAMLAALALRLHGQKPLLMDLKAVRHDFDHIVALYRSGVYWGAISKTNHAVLRFREPVYQTLRELALSYFHEYFTDDGKKTMRSYSRPLDLSIFDKRGWMTADDDVWYIAERVDTIRHLPIAPPRILRSLRRADAIEIAAGKLTDWQRHARRKF